MKDWKVINGVFIGKVLVMREVEGAAAHRMVTKEEAWLPYALDLRVVDAIKPDGFEHLERTSLYHHGDHIATVNALMTELLPHWLGYVHVFQTEPFVPAQDFNELLSEE